MSSDHDGSADQYLSTKEQVESFNDFKAGAAARFDEYIASISPTSDLLMALVDNLGDSMPGDVKVAGHRAPLKAQVQKAAATKKASDADIALAGLKELGTAVLNSGIPEAAITFAVTYKLLDSLADAQSRAIQDLSI